MFVGGHCQSETLSAPEGLNENSFGLILYHSACNKFSVLQALTLYIAEV